MPTNTTTYSFQKPVVGADEDSWGGYLNSNWDKVDDLFDGTTAITGIDINSGTIDGTVIGGSSAAAGTFTTLTASTSITGTLATAAQPNVTSLGTLTGLTVSASASLAGASTTADITFGDNDKAIFGAGSDLQIYHDGAASFIEDAGTGDLYIRGSSFVQIGKYPTEVGAKFIADGAVELYYDNSKKLATTATGVDITGTLTSDGLTVEDADGATIRIQSSDTSVDGGSLGQLEFYSNDASTGGTGVKGKIQVTDTSSFGTAYEMNFFTGYVTGGAHAETKKMSIGPFGDISFYEDTGTTAKFFWDASAEALGIGTSSPSTNYETALHLNAPSFVNLHLTTNATGTTGSDGFNLVTSSASTSLINQEATPLIFSTSATERMRINSSGNVLIGSSNAPTGYARVSLVGGEASGSGANSGIQLTYNSGAYGGGAITTVNAAGGGLDFYRFTGNVGSETYSHSMRIDSSGNVGIGTTSPNARLEVEDGGTGKSVILKVTADDSSPYAFVVGNDSFSTTDTNGLALWMGDDGQAKIDARGTGAYHTFRVQGTERMRIDSSGSLMVGTTDPSIYDDTSGNGFSVYSSGIGTFKHQAVNSSDPCLILNDTGVDSQLLQFRKGGATVGSIATDSNTLRIGGPTSTSGLGFYSSAILPQSSSTALADTSVDLGSSFWRFKDLYLSGGVYLGGTGAANKLDDYEEGSWTPTFTSSSFATGITVNNAHYAKVGDLVNISATVVFTGTTGNYTVGDNYQLGGLPFSMSDTYGRSGSGWASASSNRVGFNNLAQLTYITGNVASVYGTLARSYAATISITYRISTS
jgi:hypothetical protein